MAESEERLGEGVGQRLVRLHELQRNLAGEDRTLSATQRRRSPVMVRISDLARVE